MVKAIMYRETLPKLLNDAPDRIQKDFQSQKKKIDAEYDKILGDAIELCNSDSNMPRKVADRTSTQLLCQNIKANMKK
jgi:vacuolar-type H+-ATPase subunit H